MDMQDLRERRDRFWVTLNMVQPKFSPGLGEIDGKMISTWNLGNSYLSPSTAFQQNRLSLFYFSHLPSFAILRIDGEIRFRFAEIEYKI